MSLEDKIGRFGKWAKRGLEIAVVVAGVACMAEQCDIKFKRPNPIKVTHFADQRGDETDDVYISNISGHFNDTRVEPDSLTYSVHDFDTATAPVFLEGDTVHIYPSDWHGTQIGRVEACDGDTVYPICNSAYMVVNFNGPIVPKLNDPNTPPPFDEQRGINSGGVYTFADISDVLSHFAVHQYPLDPSTYSLQDFYDIPISWVGDTISIGPSDWHGIQEGYVEVCDGDTDSDPTTSRVCVSTPLKVIFNTKPTFDLEKFELYPASELQPLGGQVSCFDSDSVEGIPTDILVYGFRSSTLDEAMIVYGGTDAGKIYSCLDGNTSCSLSKTDPLPIGTGGLNAIDPCCYDGIEIACYSDPIQGDSVSGLLSGETANGPFEFDVNHAPEFVDDPENPGYYTIMTVSREGYTLAGALNVSDGDTADELVCNYTPPGGLEELVVNTNCTITSTSPIPYNKAGIYTFNASVTDGIVPPIQQNVKIVIDDTNVAPNINSFVINLARENEILNGQISATDFDGDTITYSIRDMTELPELQIDPVTGHLSSSSPLSYDPLFQNPWVQLRASDTHGLYDEGWYQINIEDVNRAPVITGVVFNTAQEGSVLDGLINGSDPDSDPVTCYLVSSTLPQAKVSSTCFIYSDAPLPVDTPVNYNIIVGMTDGLLGDTMSQDFEVNRPPYAPGLNPTDNYYIRYEGDLLLFNVVNNGDPNPTDTIILDSPNKPINAILNPITGQFSWPISYDDGGNGGSGTFVIYAIYFTEIDNHGARGPPTTVTVKIYDSTPPPP